MGLGTASSVNAGFVCSTPFDFWNWRSKELEEQCLTSKYLNPALKFIKRSNNAPKPGLSSKKGEVLRLKTKKTQFQLLFSPPPLKAKESWIWVWGKNPTQIQPYPQTVIKKVHVYTDLHKILSKVEFGFKAWEMLQLIKEKVSRILLL